MRKITRKIPKKNLQAMIKACRAAKLNVVKTNMGYKVYAGKVTDENKNVLTAMIGRNDYLVTMADNLFQ